MIDRAGPDRGAAGGRVPTGAVPAGAGPVSLPSSGPEPIPFETAVAAVLGYAGGRRPLRFRSPDTPHGRWVQVPAFGWGRFDAQPGRPPHGGGVGRDGPGAPGSGDAGSPDNTDILLAEGLHGRLDRAGWSDVRDALAHTRPLATAAAERAAGRALWQLPDEELSVLGEPGTVGAFLRQIRQAAGGHPGHVSAALHHRHPALVPHLTRTTRRALLPHVEEGDSGVEAVIFRELRAAGPELTALAAAVAAVRQDARPTVLRLHDILLWLRTTLRLAHAAELGRASQEWREHRTAAAATGVA